MSIVPCACYLCTPFEAMAWYVRNRSIMVQLTYLADCAHVAFPAMSCYTLDTERSTSRIVYLRQWMACETGCSCSIVQVQHQ